LNGFRYADIARRVRAALAQEHRYAHVVRVARLADRLAQRHGEDPARARLAGLLHDLARLFSAERLLAECESRGLPIDDFERRNPVVLHARLGAELAREDFGVSDPRVLEAIRHHTVAKPRMTRLDAIVYLADGLEPGRAFAEREALETLAFSNLEAAMRAVLRSTLAYFGSRGLEAAPRMLAALAYYDALERTPLSA
jgi:predicted HD superfamily hydrolase involved in NAD metabolism